MTKRNSHYLSAEEKVTWKMVVGCLSVLHLKILFLLLSAILTHSHLLSSFQTEKDRDSVIRLIGLNLECPFANFYGLRFLLSAVNLPYCDLQWVYVPSSRNIRALVCV